MLNELDMVVLMHDLTGAGLKAGDVGTVVHVYGQGAAVEVEFASGDGSTVAVETLEASAVRRLNEGEILHARSLAA